MKKAIFVVLACMLALTLALLIYLKRPVTLGESRAPELLPADTVALFQLADFERSRDRWKQTALYQISQEPEVQAFLEKPKAKFLQPDPAVANDWALVDKVRPKEAFLAVTAVTDKAPKFVAGFDYHGNRADAEALVADLKNRAKAQFPTGKSDIVKYDSREIETFQYEETTVSSVFKNHWFLVSDDLDLLKSTMDRLDGKGDAKSTLAGTAAFKSAAAKLPASSDTLFFLQPQSIIERFAALLTVSNPNVDLKEIDDLKKIQGVSAALKLDGEKIRDTIYILKPGGAAQSPMARNSLALTSSDTFLYLASVLSMESAPKLPDPALDTTGLLTILSALQQIMTAQGLSFADFQSAFGPEAGASLDWPPGVMQPALLLNLDVRDRAKAGKFVDALAGGQAGLAPWAKQDIDGVSYYSLPGESAGIFTVAPALALTDKALLLGLDLSAVQKSVQSAKSGGNHLDKAPDFQTASGLVAKPTGTFIYIDSKALFERIYGLASNTLKMMALFNPHASDYADLGKLPSTGAVSKHLSPIVYSTVSDNQGTLIESAGPVTFNQGILGVLMGGAAFYRPAALPGAGPTPPAATFPNMPGQAAPVPVATP